jgi:hypothetical protein
VKTFAALQWLTVRDIGVLIEALLDAGLLRQVELNKFRPTIEISPSGTEVMCGRCQPPVVKLPNSLIKKIQNLAPVREPQRGEVAGEGTVSASAVPATADGPPLRSAEAGEARPESAPPDLDSADASSLDVGSEALPIEWGDRLGDEAGGERPSLPEYYWTWRMFVEGFSAGETAAIRRLTAEEVWEHLDLAARHGLVVNPNWRTSDGRSSATP